MRPVAGRAFAVIAVVCLWAGSAVGQPEGRELRSFRAVYGLLEGDKRVGQAEFTLHYDRSTSRYVYESRTEFDGFLLRLAAPRPVIERSEFRLARDAIRPLSYRYEDGTRRGRRNLTLEFDWSEMRVSVTADDTSTELRAPPQALDRASVKLALGLAIRDGRRAGRHEVADPDVFRSYQFASDGVERIATPIGELEAHRVRQWRTESEREMIVWIAPALGFNVVRIEQRRPERDPVAFALETFEWLRPEGSAAADGPR